MSKAYGSICVEEETNDDIKSCYIYVSLFGGWRLYLEISIISVRTENRTVACGIAMLWYFWLSRPDKEVDYIPCPSYLQERVVHVQRHRHKLSCIRTNIDPAMERWKRRVRNIFGGHSAVFQIERNILAVHRRWKCHASTAKGIMTVYSTKASD